MLGSKKVQNAALTLLSALLYILSTTNGLDEISNLVGFADYRYVALSWDYDITDENLYGFQIHYCEQQKWGPHRCKVKSLPKETVSGMSPGPGTSMRVRRNSFIVPGLRMSTNYTFEVRPVATKRMDREYHNPRASQRVVLATKGFSAKATLCLPTESEIEVSTGPYFGGRVGVEAADGTRCTVDGDTSSPRDVYTLRINHEACGSVVNETTVTTFVLVQENLPILTHSTRRFLVLCTVQPDTLTVRARLNLPHRSSNSVDDDEGDGSVSSADMSDDEEDDLNVPGASARRRDSRMLRLRGEANADDSSDTARPGAFAFLKGDSVTQVVLMMSLVLAMAVGCAATVWFTTRPRPVDCQRDDTTSVTSSESSSPEPSVIDFEIESVCGISEPPQKHSANTT